MNQVPTQPTLIRYKQDIFLENVIILQGNYYDKTNNHHKNHSLHDGLALVKK